MNNHSFTYRIVYKTNGSPSPIQAYLSLIYLYLCTFVRRFTNVFITFVYKNTQTIVNRDYLLYTSFL